MNTSTSFSFLPDETKLDIACANLRKTIVKYEYVCRGEPPREYARQLIKDAWNDFARHNARADPYAFVRNFKPCVFVK